jgi:hypothetical protein
MMVEGEVKLEPSLRLEYAGWILSTSSLRLANRMLGSIRDDGRPLFACTCEN